jgi:hypothetical protein
VLSLPVFTVDTLELPFSRTISRTRSVMLDVLVEVIPRGHFGRVQDLWAMSPSHPSICQ